MIELHDVEVALFSNFVFGYLLLDHVDEVVGCVDTKVAVLPTAD